MPILRLKDGLRGGALAVSLVLCGTWPTAPAVAAAPPTGAVSQQSVYAAFLVNITRFIQWPDTCFSSPNAPIVVGTFPRDPINDQLDRAAKGESVGTHPLKIVRIESLEDLAACHVVYLTGSASQKQAVLARVANLPILSVSDGEGFVELGGHVRFVSRPPHTQLRIGVANLRASGLQARAQLLRLAQAEGP